jgi:hypothetical protein
MDSLDYVDNERSGSSSYFNETEENIKDSLDEYHKKFMILKHMFKHQEESEKVEKVISKQKTQLEEKDEEIKRLKNEIIS